MCAVSTSVPSCYVMCLTVQRDVCCEQMSPIILCNVWLCREMCAVSRWVPSCYVMCLTVQRDVSCEQMRPIMLCNVLDCAEKCVLWADESHHAMWFVWLCREMWAVNRWVSSCHVMCLTVQRDVCCEQMSPIMLYSVFDCREMCAVNRWVLSCYVICLTAERCVLWADEYHHAMYCVWLCREMCAVSRRVPSGYVMCLCREMCAVSRSFPSCYVMCLTAERCVLWADQSHHAMYYVWLQTDVWCEQMSPIMLCNVFDCREMCSVSRSVPSCYVMCLTTERCVLWADESHHDM